MPGSKPRLYLAESVAAVIEVKSDVASQWSEVESTAKQLRPLQRYFGASMSFGGPPAPHIPIFAVGYRGWQQLPTVHAKAQGGVVDGIFVIEPCLFSGIGVQATGPVALWAFICALHTTVLSLSSASTDPIAYAK